MKKLVLFDIDRTLIKDLRWDNASWDDTKFSEVIKKIYNADAKVEIIGNHSGMTDQEKIIAMLKKKGFKEKDIMPKMKYCMKALIESFKNLDNSNFIVLSGVKNLLKALEKNKVLIGVVTGNIKYIAKGKLKKVGLYKYFKVGAFGEDSEKRSKLIKIAIKRAKEKFGFKLNNNAFLVGDTPRDVKAAKEAGIKAIAVASGSIWSEKQLKDAGADFVLKDLKDVEKFLKIINSN
jgi:phosphoglycolate phosphatase-like HAD superfamily hydrolase